MNFLTRVIRSSGHRVIHFPLRLSYSLGGLLLPPAKKAPESAKRGALDAENDFKHLSFTFAVIALSAQLARLDGEITKAKYLAFRQSFPLSGQMCGKLRSLFALACGDATPHTHYIRQIRYIFPRQPALFTALIDRLFSIAGADGAVSPASERWLARASHRLGLNGAEYAAIRARHEGRPQAHQVLGVKRRASPAMLKKRYRELMRAWHPDRFAGSEVSPEVALLLKLKASEINEAYRVLSKKAA
ncbi:MAG: molecular chaperone DjiA [Pseudomonadota bacterium]|nr:molecular chaperone DjiA [Pseudomonadota bacterium]MDE3037246.1 molecular chaperone DjiA [Pseudomonadota bacterium]